jgi:signal peptidase II
LFSGGAGFTSFTARATLADLSVFASFMDAGSDGMIKSRTQEKREERRKHSMQRRVWPLWVYYAVAVAVFVIDYASKKIIENNVKLNDRIEVLGNFFIITSIRNRGAAFGILQEQRWFFLVITIVVVTAIVWYFQRSYRTGHPLLMIALGMILGGAVGNFLDRALFGQVVDFLQFNFGSYTFPIFNLADSGICIGVVLVIIDSLLSYKQENKTHDDGEQTREQQPV